MKTTLNDAALKRIARKMAKEEIKTYYISTDAASMELEAPNFAEAIKIFGECPESIKTPKDFERWLEKTEGYGFVEENGILLVRVDS